MLGGLTMSRPGRRRVLQPSKCRSRHAALLPCSQLAPCWWHTCCLQEEAERGGCVGLDVATGEPADPHLGGVLDNYVVKRQILQRWGTLPAMHAVHGCGSRA